MNEELLDSLVVDVKIHPCADSKNCEKKES
jgi:hypothetical protein